MSYNGRVSDVSQEKFTSKAGKPCTVWWTTLDDGTRVTTGFTKPVYSVGDTISFEAETKYGKLELNQKSLTIGGGAAKPVAPAATVIKSGPAGGSRGVFPIPKNDGQFSIIRQNSLTNANATVAAWFDGQGALADTLSLEDFAEKVLEVAYLYADFSSGQREVKFANDARADVVRATGEAE